MAAPTGRAVTPLVAKIRDLLCQRKVINHCRYEQLQSPRSGPAPKLPPGASHNLAENYYYTRDGRRESMPPALLYEAGRKALESGGESAQSKAATVRAPLPGLSVHNWDM